MGAELFFIHFFLVFVCVYLCRSDWKMQLKRPAKDTRIKTEVGKLAVAGRRFLALVGII